MSARLSLIPLEDRIVLDGAIAAALIPAVSSVVHAADSAHTLYVDAGVASGNHSGDSWANAYSDIQTALTRATAGASWDIKVAAGTYTPAAHGGYTMATGASIVLEGSIDPLTGNPSNTPTTFVDGAGLNTSSLLTIHSGHVVIEGFTFKNGNSTSATAAGLTMDNHSTVLLINVAFNDNQNNAAGFTIQDGLGAAIYAENSDLYVSNSTFTNNQALVWSGGAIAAMTLPSDTATHVLAIDGSTFTDNFGYYNGGAINAENVATVAIGNSHFINNSSIVDGGGAVSLNLYASYDALPIVTTSLSITDSTFSGNTANNGGAVYAFDSTHVYMTNDSFSNNTASASGGAVEVLGAGTLSVTNGTFSGNSASDNGGALVSQANGSTAILGVAFSNNSTLSGDGGAIYAVQGPISVTNSVFTSNASARDGGAVNAQSSVAASFTNSTFTGNTAARNGGAIEAQLINAVDVQFGSAVSVNNSNFTGNTAGNAGGAVDVQSSSSAAVDGSTFTGNVSTADGGAIRSLSNTTTTLSGDTFSNNSATGNGGAIASSSTSTFSVTSSHFTNSHSGAKGGAVYAFEGVSFSFTQNTFAGSSAIFGGAIDVIGAGSTTILNNTFDTGSAITGSELNLQLIVTINGLSSADSNMLSNLVVNNTHLLSGEINLFGLNLANILYVDVNNTSGLLQTGADWAHALSDLQLVSFLFGIPANWHMAFANGVYVMPSTIYMTGGTITLEGGGPGVYGSAVSSTIFQGQNVGSSGGINITAVDALHPTNVTIAGVTFKNYTGAAVHASSGANLTLTNDSFTTNSFTFDSLNRFAAVYAVGAGNISVSGSTFSNNTSQSSGAALYAGNNQSLTVSSSTFSNNTSLMGGAIYAFNNGSFTVDASTFSGNKALKQLASVLNQNTGSGGAIFSSSNGITTLSGDTFTNNQATNAGGGAISTIGEQLSIDGSTFTGNIAAQGFGGAIVGVFDSALSITDSSFSGNTSSSDGGAIRLTVLDDSTVVSVVNSTFTGNSSVSFGGALDVFVDSLDSASDPVAVIIENSGFFSNSSGFGGAVDIVVFNEPAVSMAIGNSAFSDNTASYGGAVSLFDVETVSIDNSTFTDNNALVGGGGALYVPNNSHFLVAANSTLTVNDSTFSGNASAGDGGAIDNTSDRSVTLSGNTFINNSTVGDGGAVASSSSEALIVSGNTFTNNSVVGNVTVSTTSIRLFTDSEPNNTDTTAQIINVSNLGIFADPNLTNSNIPSIQITGSLTGDDHDVFRFFLRAGETINVDVDTGALSNPIDDTTLTLRNASGAQVAFNDDSSIDTGSVSPYNSNLTYTVGVSGFYFLDLAKFDGSVSDGNYLLNVTKTSSRLITESASNNTIATAQTIPVSAFGAAGDSNLANPKDPSVQISGSLTLNDHDIFKIFLRAGETLTADVDTGTLVNPITDTTLTLRNSSGTQVAFNDDSGTDTGSVTGANSLLVYTVSVSGFYTLDLTKFDSSVPDGNYLLNVSIAEGNLRNSRLISETGSAHTTDSTAQIVNISDFTVAADPNLTDPSLPSVRITGALTADNHDVYRVFLRAGDTFTADVDTGLLSSPIDDTTLTLRNGDGTTVAFNDDSSIDTGSISPYNSNLTYTVNKSGFYFLDLGKYDATVSDGNYLLNLSYASGHVVQDSGSHSTDATAQVINTSDFGLTYSPYLTNTNDPSVQITGALTGNNNDVYRFFLRAGETINADVDTGTLSSPIDDTTLTLRDANGAQVAFNDDSSIDSGSISPYNSNLTYTAATSGFYFLDLAKYDATVTDGNYLLNVSVNEGHVQLPVTTITGGNGGAIYVEGGPLSVDASAFTLNTATNSGGAIAAISAGTFTVTHSSFDHNGAGTNGGAIYGVTDLSTVILGNSFNTDTATTGSEINLQYVITVNGVSSTSASVFDSLTTHNTGLSNNEIYILGINPANTLYVDVNNTSDLPQTGADWEHAISNIELVNLVLALPADWDIAFANGVYDLSSTINVTSGSVTFEGGYAGVYDNTFSTTIFDGQNSAAQVGIHVSSNDAPNHLTSLTVSGITFTNFTNSAIYSVGANLAVVNDLFTNNSTPDTSVTTGAVFASTGGSILISGSTFNNNVGGAITSVSNNSFTVTGSTFSNNITPRFSIRLAGAIYVVNTAGVSIDTSHFSGNATDYKGGAILIESSDTVSINTSTFVGNFTRDLGVQNNGSGGGAVWIHQADAVSMNGNTFTANTTHGRGGAVDVVVSGSVFIDNSTYGGNTADLGGGAISAEYTEFASIDNSTFTSNTSLAVGGGALYMHGIGDSNGGFFGIIHNSVTNDTGLMITNSGFSDNTTTSGDGGAVYATSISGPVSIDHSTFANNAADEGGALSFDHTGSVSVVHSTFTDNTATDGSGGALFVNNTGGLSVTTSTFSGNTSTVKGGALFASAELSLSFTGNTFIGNSAEAGGAIGVLGGSSATILGNTFDTDSAIIGSELYLQYIVTINGLSSADGGVLNNLTTHNTGLSNNEIFLVGVNSTNTVYVDSNNTSTAPQTGADWAHAFSDFSFINLLLGIPANWDFVFAKGVYVLPSITVTGNSVTFEGGGNGVYGSTVNSTIFEAGGAFVVGSGGSLFFVAGEGSIVATASGNLASPTNLTVKGITFRDFTAGGAVISGNANFSLINDSFLNNFTVSAGVVAVGAGGNLSISGSTFSNNFTTYGGAVNVSGAHSFTVDSSTFSTNRGSRGAAITASGNGSFTVTNSTFSGNTAAVPNDPFPLPLNVNPGQGGAIYALSNGPIVFSGDTFTNNNALNGGAVYLGTTNGTVSISGSTFTGNTADANGGGAYVYHTSGAVSISNSLFSDNQAKITTSPLLDVPAGGGALFLDSNGPVTISGSTFRHNNSLKFGGGVAVTNTAGAVTVDNSQFLGNTSTSSGGGLYASRNSSLLVSNSTFNSNQLVAGASGNGAAIRDDLNGSSSFINDTFINNSAAGFGGAIAYRGIPSSTLYLENLTLSGNSAGYGGALYDVGRNSVIAYINSNLQKASSSEDKIGLMNLFISHDGDAQGLDVMGKEGHTKNAVEGNPKGSIGANIVSIGGATAGRASALASRSLMHQSGNDHDTAKTGQANAVLGGAFSAQFNTSISSGAWGAVGLWILAFDNSQSLYVAATGLGSSAGTAKATMGSTSTVTKGATASAGGLHLVYGNFVKWLSSVSKSITKLTVSLGHLLHLPGSHAPIVTGHSMEGIDQLALSTVDATVVASNTAPSGNYTDISGAEFYAAVGVSGSPVGGGASMSDTDAAGTMAALNQAHETVVGNTAFCNGALKVKTVV